MEASVHKLNLIRLVRDGKKDDICEYVEIVTLEGKAQYLNISELSKLERRHRTDNYHKHFPFWAGKNIRILTTVP